MKKKDPNKIKEINDANASLRPLDIVGRELRQGDFVAYASLGGYGKYKGMMTGTIKSVSKQRVTIDTGSDVYANRCCLISRKDGDQIK